MATFKRIALTLVIIGAINWGLIGFFNFDLVAAIFGGQTAALSRIIYGLVGLSGLYCISMLFSPMEEANLSQNHQRRLNYNTEFAEEVDFFKEDEKNNNL